MLPPSYSVHCTTSYQRSVASSHGRISFISRSVRLAALAHAVPESLLSVTVAQLHHARVQCNHTHTHGTNIVVSYLSASSLLYVRKNYALPGLVISRL